MTVLGVCVCVCVSLHLTGGLFLFISIQGVFAKSIFRNLCRFTLPSLLKYQPLQKHSRSVLEHLVLFLPSSIIFKEEKGHRCQTRLSGVSIPELNPSLGMYLTLKRSNWIWNGTQQGSFGWCLDTSDISNYLTFTWILQSGPQSR